jgi:hypothetical protein
MTPYHIPAVSYGSILVTVVLLPVLGRAAMLILTGFGVYTFAIGGLWIASSSEWERVVAWRRTASGAALWMTGFTRSADHESRYVAGLGRCLVGLFIGTMSALAATGVIVDG